MIQGGGADVQPDLSPHSSGTPGLAPTPPPFFTRLLGETICNLWCNPGSGVLGSEFSFGFPCSAVFIKQHGFEQNRRGGEGFRPRGFFPVSAIGLGGTSMSSSQGYGKPVLQ